MRSGYPGLRAVLVSGRSSAVPETASPLNRSEGDKRVASMCPMPADTRGGGRSVASLFHTVLASAALAKNACTSHDSDRENYQHDCHDAIATLIRNAGVANLRCSRARRCSVPRAAR
jgi:hypothetical protein